MNDRLSLPASAATVFPAVPRFLDGGGEATRLVLERDWTQHPLGPPDTWPDALKVAISLVFNSPESMILAWDVDDLWFFFNETYIPLLGPRRTWAMGTPFRDVWADGWAQAKPIIDAACAGESRRFTDMPWRLATDRGEADTWFTFSYSRVLDSAGDVAGVFIYTNETTQRVVADAALARTQDELRALNESLERRVDERTAERDRMWDTSPDLMVVIAPDGRYVRTNPAWYDVLGYRPDELVGLHAMALVHPDDLAASDGALMVAQAGQSPTVENRLRHRDGSYRWLSWVAANADREILATGRHVTQVRESAEALRRAEEQLRQAQKMEAVGQLTGGLAHDFNNLLAGISGSLELMRLRMDQGRMGDVDKYIVAAQGAARRAAALTHRLLAFSRRQTLAPLPTDANRLVAGMHDLIQRTVGPAVHLDVVGASDLWTVLVDPPQLESALLNLCINARDAMPGGGRIVVETANQRIDRAAGQEHGLPEGEYVALTVSDTGTGMTRAVIEKAFEPFFTTKPIGEGTGLGLSMIYGFAKQSNGQVRIESEPGAGTTVRLHLPRSLDASVRTDDARARGVLDGAETGEHVLVVDDEPTVRSLIVEVLTDAGYTPLEAADSVSGLALLRSNARIDLLITDVGLPGGMNGRQMADAGRVGRPALKVLFITGYAETALVGNGQLAPGMAVLAKPFPVASLVARIREMIAA